MDHSDVVLAGRKIGLHVEEDAKQQTQTGGRVACETVVGNLRVKGDRCQNTIREEKSVVLLLRQVEKLEMVGMTSLEVIGDRLSVVGVSLDLASLRIPRKTYYYE